MFNLESNVRSWSDYLRGCGKLKKSDIIELEDHLQDEIEDLIKAGLSSEEAFLISVKRLGNINAISQEFSKVNTENLWKHLMVESDQNLTFGQNRKTIALVIVFSLLAGTAMKIPELFGLSMYGSANGLAYLKNISLFILPFIAAFFLIKNSNFAYTKTP